MRYELATTIRAFDERVWDAVVGDRLMLSHRWQRVTEATRTGYAPRYVLLHDERGPAAAIVTNSNDTFGRRGWREWALQHVTLMARSSFTTEGGIALRHGLSLAAILPDVERALGAACWRTRRPLLAINNVSPEHLSILRARGYAALGGQPPNAVLDLPPADYDRYVAALGKKDRAELRRVRRHAEAAGARFDHAWLDRPDDRLWPLFREVAARHDMLDTPWMPPAALFDRLAHEMPRDTIVFRGTIGAALAGYLLCFVRGTTLWWYVAGLRYELARPSYLYFVLIDEMIRWAIDNGIRRIEGGTANYEQKRRHGFRPEQRWMCVRLFPSPLHRAAGMALPALRSANRSAAAHANEEA